MNQAGYARRAPTFQRHLQLRASMKTLANFGGACDGRHRQSQKTVMPGKLQETVYLATTSSFIVHSLMHSALAFGASGVRHSACTMLFPVSPAKQKPQFRVPPLLLCSIRVDSTVRPCSLNLPNNKLHCGVEGSLDQCYSCGIALQIDASTRVPNQE